MPTQDTPPPERIGLGGTFLERQDDAWCIVAIVDGIHKVVSRHPTRELGEMAFEQYRTGEWPEERRSEHRP